MSGVYFDYVKIVKGKKNKYDAEGTGCGCCAHSYELTRKEVQEYIEELKEKIEQLEQLIKE